MMAFNPKEFLEWFQQAGGWYNEEYLGLKPFPGMGYGATALQDIPEDVPLFHIPDSLILSPYTSELSKYLTAEEWERVDRGWNKIILVMIRESGRGDESPWSGYLSNMPTEFDTPMMWNDEERKELIGTDIEDRIGKEDAEKEYKENLLPIIQAHPELFPPSSPHHTLDSFHIQGSRILSRSFTVPASRFNASPKPADGGDDESDFSDDEDEEGEETVVMIPFADMLNAAYQRDNANLFTDEKTKEKGGQWDKRGFTMKSTKPIGKDEQIYNTYASPPNSELLRKYGHVDVLSIPTEQVELLSEEEIGDWPFGNPGDEILIDGKVIIESIEAVLGKKRGDEEKWQAKVSKRVDWWLEEGLDDMFPLTLSPGFDDEFIAFIRLLLYDSEWLRAKKKGKLPTTTIDKDVASVIVHAVQIRLSKYTGDLKSDLEVIKSISADHIPRPTTSTALLEQSNADDVKKVDPSALRRCYAAVVRLGEKRILQVALRNAEKYLPQKRKAEDGST
ncbi:uncharacterized protein I303_100536 [Kwoniella dejecticola CBS 10117]|uniref:SET domain-containing protein n=1 Tax=Kwoniella dejecticola CBS 10117 TaxID=1296121 RepID=A0A1A6AF73_9TREE|nr:uncharacterized protein I303_00537 [Kwoniella dejecticola CBS 10117]OBR88720.1 hypothetical protein I303_00537 [Kwoniella dejecticola CBS 10117]